MPKRRLVASVAALSVVAATVVVAFTVYRANGTDGPEATIGVDYGGAIGTAATTPFASARRPRPRARRPPPRPRRPRPLR